MRIYHRCIYQHHSTAGLAMDIEEFRDDQRANCDVHDRNPVNGVEEATRGDLANNHPRCFNEREVWHMTHYERVKPSGNNCVIIHTSQPPIFINDLGGLGPSCYDDIFCIHRSDAQLTSAHPQRTAYFHRFPSGSTPLLL